MARYEVLEGTLAEVLDDLREMGGSEMVFEVVAAIMAEVTTQIIASMQAEGKPSQEIADTLNECMVGFPIQARVNEDGDIYPVCVNKDGSEVTFAEAEAGATIDPLWDAEAMMRPNRFDGPTFTA